ncbi:MAG TPA: signal peptidase I, partial [Blastocatellia bacterium]|nr:signal peptidase I [Blastocatellia bacterium]
MSNSTDVETQSGVKSAGAGSLGSGNGKGQSGFQQTVIAEEPATETRTRSSRKVAPTLFKKSVAREYFESAVVTFVMAIFGMTFIVQAVKVPTGSMKNTIYIGDHLLVNKFIFGESDGLKAPIFPARNIRRGDIIVFKYPWDPQTNYVKRVIGLPGETIEYNSRTHRVYVDGKELPE